MTSIVIFQSERDAVVAMDTLAIDQDRTPGRYTTKAHYLPHLRTIIAGTGCGGFADDWFAEVNKRLVIRDVLVLNELAPPMLRDLWGRFRSEYDLKESTTTTIFHIGKEEETGRVVVCQFHSGNGFEPEALDGSLAFKPVCPEPPELEQGDLGAFDLILPIMEAQRAHEAEKPPERRVYIGGQIQVIHLSDDGCAYFNLHDFPEYEREREYVYRKAQFGNG